MLYTRKGDSGTTKAFDSGPGERMSKASCQTEALGALDELNSLLGFVRAKAVHSRLTANGITVEEILRTVQGRLFIVQAECAGAPKAIAENHVLDVERIIDEVEKTLPPIKSFVVPGGTELSALLDVARTVSRRAERRAIEFNEESVKKLSPHTLSYLNRLSSLLYALARLANHRAGVVEKAPDYS